MHIYFSGIGGAAIGPLALIAKQAGYEVSGSDKQSSQYLDYLKKRGIINVHIGQSRENISNIHNQSPIDWFVYSSAVAIENPDSPELAYCREQNIKISKRDELINLILEDKKLNLIAVAGTHGKTTTTAMVIWLFKQLGIPVSYSLGAKISFGDMGHFDSDSKYFVYEADEFDRNFLAFEPFASLITGVSWDHHEIFPTREDYQSAFREFISQSEHTLIWQEDADYLGITDENKILNILASDDSQINSIKLKGQFNRLDAWLAIQTFHSNLISGNRVSLGKLIVLMDKFPGLSRRMEEIVPNLFSDYAHTPEKIRGAMSVASEMAQDTGQDLIFIYEPLTNRRQHFAQNEYKDVFSGAERVYWIPSYLAREDPSQAVLTPAELIAKLDDPSIAVPMERDGKLKMVIQEHLDKGDMVVGMAGGGGDSLDDWLREEFKP
ncbi:MAG TPA: Mur ligase domain-containing protein [Candidatus Saccharimonadales bacterium]|nr:Mur ligase domain-containing protein [Candidatus Saccharimonadales bacterium]